MICFYCLKARGKPQLVKFNFEHILHFFLVFLFLTLNKLMLAGLKVRSLTSPRSTPHCCKLCYSYLNHVATFPIECRLLIKIYWNSGLPWDFLTFQKQPTEVFWKKCVLENFLKFAGKHLCQSLFLIKLQAWGLPATLLKTDSGTGVFCEFWEIFKNVFLVKHLLMTITLYGSSIFLWLRLLEH